MPDPQQQDTGKQEPQKARSWILVGFVVALAIALTVAWVFFFLRGRKQMREPSPTSYLTCPAVLDDSYFFLSSGTSPGTLKSQTE
jgi:hypothetical protein